MWNFGGKSITLYEKWKCYIRPLKMLHPNFENVLSEFMYVLHVKWETITIKYSRTRIKETRIKETFGYKKHFHSSAFMQVKLSTLIGQLINETMDKRNFFPTALWVSFIRVWLYIQYESRKV